MRLLLMSGLAVFFAACGDKDTTSGDSGAEAIDADEDGFVEADDCDDNNPDINPDADEICDEIDNNCDGDIDSGLGLTIYNDADADGFGNEGTSATSCEVPDGYATVGGDCNDADPNVNPDAEEVCNGLDENCNGEADDNAIDSSAYFADSDNDGIGDSSTEVISCVRPSNYVDVGGDCDDTNDAIWPGNAEACDGIDNDCDSTTTDAGSVSFEERGGNIVDLTEVFQSGTSLYPARYYVDKPGTMTFCGGAWKGALIIAADVDIIGNGGAANNVLDAADEFPSILLESGARNVYVEGMTFRRGRANLSGLNSYRRSGGGVYCNTGANLDFEDVVIKEAEAEAGGAMYISNCPTTINNSEFKNNTGVFGAFLATDQGNITIENSTITDNTSNYYGGGFYLYSQYGAVTLNLTDTHVSNNTGYYGGAMYLYRYSYNVNVTCTATKKGGGGFTGNSSTYNPALYLYMNSTSSFKSNGCDFGEDGASDDNAPNDIYFYQSYYSSSTEDYGDDAYFTCTNSSGCY